MIVEFTEDYSYSLDKVTVVKSCCGDTKDLPNDLALRLIAKGVCGDKRATKFNPVVETAVISPVEEVKEKTKRKRRSKKKAE